MHADVRAALRLQELDSQLDALHAEVAALPKRIAEIERTLEAHTKKLEIEKATLVANQKQRKEQEIKIQGFEQKKSHLKNQIMEARTNEQYWAFQKEIKFLEDEISASETRILELMESAEPLESRVKQAEAELAQERKLVEEEKREAQKRTAEDKAEIARISAQRAAAEKEISPLVYNAYKALRQRPRGIAVSECVDERCRTCNISIRPQLMQDLRRGDSVHFCENCGRILYLDVPIVIDEYSQPNA